MYEIMTAQAFGKLLAKSNPYFQEGPVVPEVDKNHISSSNIEGTPNTLSGKWVNVNESMSDASRTYQKQITGREGQAFLQNGVKFDGMENGILIETKGSYKNFVNKKTGEFYDWFKGKDSLVDQANRQIAASEGAQINWYFSEEASMNATKSLFQSQGIKGINFIFEPLK